MKRPILVLIAFLGIVNFVNAQNYTSLSKVKFSDKEIHAEYMDQVFDCCCYLMQTPENKKDDNRKVAIDFVIRWAMSSSDHIIVVDEQIKQLLEEREDLLALYSVFYVNASMENKGLDPEAIKDRALDSFERYCFNSSNKVKVTKAMKELYQMKNEGDVASIDDYYLQKENVN